MGGWGGVNPTGLPLSWQTDARLLGAAFAQREQLPDDLLRLPQHHRHAGLQLGVAFLEGGVSGPELGDGGHVQEVVSGQVLHEGFEFIWREKRQINEK